MCGICKERFRSENQVKAHAISYHNRRFLGEKRVAGQSSNSRFNYVTGKTMPGEPSSTKRESKTPRKARETLQEMVTGATCRYCGKEFTTRGHMLVHIRMDHKPKPVLAPSEDEKVDNLHEG